jgi:hypothetical protein
MHEVWASASTVGDERVVPTGSQMPALSTDKLVKAGTRKELVAVVPHSTCD